MERFVAKPRDRARSAVDIPACQPALKGFGTGGRRIGGDRKKLNNGVILEPLACCRDLLQRRLAGRVIVIPGENGDLALSSLSVSR